MPNWSAHQLQRLEAIGIELWARRSVEPDDELRIRLSAGHGEWLLVQRAPWRGQFEPLLNDITHTLGVAHCRFGQWANTQESGVPVSQLRELGVHRVIAFGPIPKDRQASMVIEVPTMQALNDAPDARRQLWQSLRDHL